MFKVVFSFHGERAFTALSHEVQKWIAGELTRFAEDPQWYKRFKKLRGTQDRYRFRVGRWRILFTLRSKEIEIADIFMKKAKAIIGAGEYNHDNPDLF